MKSEKAYPAALNFISSQSSLKMRVSMKKEKTERHIVYSNEEMKLLKYIERNKVIDIGFLDFILTSSDFISIVGYLNKHKNQNIQTSVESVNILGKNRPLDGRENDVKTSELD